ncbi:hypothetical protein Q0590_37465, partial [Rhodocytophaga aerolata]
LFLSLVLLSCQATQIKKEDEISAIIEATVMQDSLDVKTPIAEEIRPFIYFPIQRDENGIEMPPPAPDYSGVHHVNEVIIASGFEYTEQYKLTRLDTLHIKQQLLHPQEVSIEKKAIPNADIFSIEAAKKPSGRKVKKCYIFSMPLFSADSAVVYVQYDYLPVDVTAHGSFIILAKQQDKWKKIGGGPTWMQ